MHGKNSVFLAAGLLLLLGGCTMRPVSAATETEAPDVAAMTTETYRAEESDGLAGRYENTAESLLLTLDGHGGCTLLGAELVAAGRYAVSSEGILLDFGSRQELATRSPAGELTVSGRSGSFVPCGAADAALPDGNTERLLNADGSFRWRDFGAQLACTCAAGIEVLPDGIPGALSLTDGSGGYVVGRNVTGALAENPGNARAFLEDYVNTRVPADFETLCGGHGETDGLLMREGETDGRLASAELTLRCGDSDYAVRVILYTSTYSDGTINYVCKTCYASADNADALAEAVTDMSALRKTPQP